MNAGDSGRVHEKRIKSPANLANGEKEQKAQDDLKSVLFTRFNSVSTYDPV